MQSPTSELRDVALESTEHDTSEKQMALVGDSDRDEVAEGNHLESNGAEDSKSDMASSERDTSSSSSRESDHGSGEESDDDDGAAEEIANPSDTLASALSALSLQATAPTTPVTTPPSQPGAHISDERQHVDFRWDFGVHRGKLFADTPKHYVDWGIKNNFEDDRPDFGRAWRSSGHVPQVDRVLGEEEVADGLWIVERHAMQFFGVSRDGMMGRNYDQAGFRKWCLIDVRECARLTGGHSAEQVKAMTKSFFAHIRRATGPFGNTAGDFASG